MDQILAETAPESLPNSLYLDVSIVPGLSIRVDGVEISDCANKARSATSPSWFAPRRVRVLWTPRKCTTLSTLWKELVEPEAFLASRPPESGGGPNLHSRFMHDSWR